MPEHYWLETLGCPKNKVDSEKLAGTLLADGLRPAASVEQADVVVVNTCAFIEAARQESIDTILELAEARAEGARIVVTGCLAERYGAELSRAMPEVDLVAGFGVPVTLGRRGQGHRAEGTFTDSGGPAEDSLTSFDLLNLPRPTAEAPWAYVKVAEGCDRRCGFCAIPHFRGRQRSRSAEAVLREVEELGENVREVVLVAQDLASWGLDIDTGDNRTRASGAVRPLVGLVREVSRRVERVRLLYLYPSSLDETLIDAVAETGVPYYDLSLQHVSQRLLRSMKRPGDGAKFLEKIAYIRSVAPDAALRSSFILGYPGETESDHDELLRFVEDARLDWAGFFTFSEEEGTYAKALDGKVPPALALERLRECSEIQDRITAERRAEMVGERHSVLVDRPGVGRSHREAPEIDGVVHLEHDAQTGSIEEVIVTGSAGPDLWAEPARVASGAAT